MNELITIEDLSFQLSGNPILCDISLHVADGEYLSIVGPNGAGKSTLLKCLMRIFEPDQGSIQIHARELKTYTQRDLARLVSYVPQTDGRSLPFTVREFVTMGRYPWLNPFSSLASMDMKPVHRAMEMTHITGFRDRNINTLSGGEKQKVLIAAALAQESRIMLLDEPTTFLDPGQHEEILSILARINREWEVTMISATHDINSALLSGHRILALKDGKKVFLDQSDAFCDNRILRELYTREFNFVEHPQSGQRIVAPEIHT